MNAIVQMEEKYADLNISYNTLEEKENIFKTNEKAILKYNMSPNIFFKPIKPGTGRVSIEFGTNNRKIGKYFEYMIKEMNLKIKNEDI